MTVLQEKLLEMNWHDRSEGDCSIVDRSDSCARSASASGSGDVTNPFDSGLADSLHQHTFSPSVFRNVTSPAEATVR